LGQILLTHLLLVMAWSTLLFQGYYLGIWASNSLKWKSIKPLSMEFNHHSQVKALDKFLNQVQHQSSLALRDQSLYHPYKIALVCLHYQLHRIVQQANLNKRPRRESSRSLLVLQSLRKKIILSSAIEMALREALHLTGRVPTVKGTIRGRER